MIPLALFSFSRAASPTATYWVPYTTKIHFLIDYKPTINVVSSEASLFYL